MRHPSNRPVEDTQHLSRLSPGVKSQAEIKKVLETHDGHFTVRILHDGCPLREPMLANEWSLSASVLSGCTTYKYILTNGKDTSIALTETKGHEEQDSRPDSLGYCNESVSARPSLA
jgi:hypothetical protein